MEISILVDVGLRLRPPLSRPLHLDHQADLELFHCCTLYIYKNGCSYIQSVGDLGSAMNNGWEVDNKKLLKSLYFVLDES